jgi:hypothetical protein
VFFVHGDYAIATITFDLWKFRIRFDIFSLIVNFINKEWIPCHITIGLFETLDIWRVVLVRQVKALLAKFNFINKFLAYGKDESKNLAILKETKSSL